MRGFIHVYACLNTKLWCTNSSCFPLWRSWKTNIITSWLQGAVGSKAGIKSQNMLNQLNKSLVLIVLCCVKCWSKTNNGKCLLIICFNLISDSYGGATWQPSAWEPWQQSQPGPGCSLRLYTLSLLHTSDPCFSSSYFFCLARCGFRLFPSFRWDTLWGVYSVVILP